MLFLPVKVAMGGEGQSRTLYSSGPALIGRQLEAYAISAGNMTVPLTGIGEDLLRDVTGSFETEGAYDGNPRWRQLSTAYGEYKQSKVPGVPILVGIRHVDKGTREHPVRGGRWVRSGLMKSQMRMPAVVTERRMLYAPPSDIAGYHEFGTSRMPARPPVQINPSTLARWDGMWVRWLNALAEEHGL